MSYKKNLDIHRRKSFNNLSVMLKEFELAYNLAPRMTKQQVRRLIKKFETILAERMNEIKQVELNALSTLSISSPYQTNTEES